LNSNGIFRRRTRTQSPPVYLSIVTPVSDIDSALRPGRRCGVALAPSLHAPQDTPRPSRRWWVLSPPGGAATAPPDDRGRLFSPAGGDTRQRQLTCQSHDDRDAQLLIRQWIVSTKHRSEGNNDDEDDDDDDDKLIVNNTLASGAAATASPSAGR